MPASEPPATRLPPVLASGLLAAGLGCATAGAWLTQFDLTGCIEQRIIQAQGSVSAETGDWLRNGHFPERLIFGGLLSAVAGGLAFFLRSNLRDWLHRFASGRIGAWGTAAACLLVFAWYFPTLSSGYFRYDDFELLAVAQDGAFWSTLWQPHGDHVLPLTRVLAFAGLKLFGVTAWPYNLWLLLCLSGVVVAGMLLLGEIGASRAAQWLYAVLVAFWSPWGEMMAGYYILSTYLLIALLGISAAWFYLRWRRHGGTCHAAALAGCVLLAPLIDVSGGYVIGICGVFLGLGFAERNPGTGFRLCLDRHKYLLGGVTLAAVAGATCLVYAYQVVNPNTFLRMAGGEGRTPGEFVRDLVYLLGTGNLLSMVTPFVYARLPAALLGSLTFIAVTTWLVFLAASLRSALPPRRRVLFALLLVVLGTGLMVTLGRPTAETWIVRWAAKHICPTYLWLCLLVAASWDALWAALAAGRRQLLVEFTVLGLIGFITLQCTFGLLGMAVSFPPFGYPAEIRDAGRREAAIERLRQQVVGVMIARLGEDAVVPTLDGNYLKASYPSLFSYNLSHYRPFFGDTADRLQLIRNPAMQSWHTPAVKTRPALRDAVTPGLPRLLAEDPVLRSLYFAEVPLETSALPIDHATSSNPALHHEGRSAIVVRAEAWDPETLPRLFLSADVPSSGANPTITVIFWSELLQDDWRGTLTLPRTPGQMTEVDLRQIYAFSLSPRVANLRVILPAEGSCWFRLAEPAR